MRLLSDYGPVQANTIADTPDTMHHAESAGYSVSEYVHLWIDRLHHRGLFRGDGSSSVSLRRLSCPPAEEEPELW